MDYLYIYLFVVAGATVLYVLRQQRIQRTHSAKLEASIQGGMVEPPSLHPTIDNVRCIGSGACVKACPEQALGIVGGKAVLVNAAACIGHGACRKSCPVDAIQLVFGTAKRGIDIPEVSPEFETNVPGIFIAGELGGMGLIRKACEQGRQAIDSIRKRKGGQAGSRGKGDFDVVIVGCGPAGFSAGLAAMQHKLRYKLIEQEDSLGGAVYHYPRQKITMSAPVDLALIGKVKFGEFGKEKLLEFWVRAMRKTGLKIDFRERMEGIVPAGDGFVVRTTRGQYRAHSVLLSMGRRGTPRKLDVPGEESAKVVYRLIDPAQFRCLAVLVVGGGDSALEAAIAISQHSGSDVTISYRREAFSRANQKNRMLLEQQQDAGRVRVLFNSRVLRIRAQEVELEHAGAVKRYRNHAVIVCAGGQLPTPLLQEIGIHFETKFGTA
ncbi:MAG: NAD(P)-binding domain-containing protein [Burkholderiaceae bacterium]